MRYTFIVICFAFLALGSLCHAQEGNTVAAHTATSVSSELAAANLYELNLLKLVLAKGGNTELSRSVHKMMGDHQRLETKLNAYANRQNVPSDNNLGERYNARLKDWNSRESGAVWDRAMLDELIGNHQQMVALMERSSDADAGLKDITRQYTPLLKSHLDMLIPLRAKMSPGIPVAAVANGTKPEKEDAKFLSDMMSMNQYGLILMELVLAKGSHRDFKDAVQRMIEDHHHLTDRANAFATGRGYNIDASDRNAYAAKLSKWTAKRGGMEWDADMVEELTDVHKDEIDALQDALKDVEDDEMKVMMNETLSSLNAHMTVLASLKEKVKKPWNNK